MLQKCYEHKKWSFDRSFDMKKIIARILVLLLVINMVNLYVPTMNVKAEENHASVTYQSHCQSYGWLGYMKDGMVSGIEGKAKRLEAIKIKVDSNLQGSIEYSVHCQTYGWMDYVKDWEVAGTNGESKRLESIKIRLTGELAENYDVIYRVHRQSYGWTDWVKNDEECGTTGQGKRLEAIQIKLIKKNETPTASVSYRTHCQTYGWLSYVKNGASSGTTGESKRLEAINIDVDSNMPGGIEYSVHCQTYGWMDWKANGLMAGTSGQAKRLEAIKIRLTGDLEKYFDVYYRVHSQSFGWLDWAKNGEISGTAGLAKRLESIQIMLVRKTEDAPGSTARPYVDKDILLKEELEKKENDNTKPDEKTPENQTPSTQPFVGTGKFVDDINKVELHPMKTNDPYIDAQVEKILAEIIKPNMTNAEKLWACHMWLINNASKTVNGDDRNYPSSWGNTKVNYASFEDLRIVSFSHSVLIGNGKRYGSCINYASAFVILARAIGFDAYRGAGQTIRSDGSYTEHYWTLVNAGGIYYNFDAEVPDTNHVLDPKNYFGKTRAEFEKLGFKWVPTSDGRTPEDYILKFNNFKVK